MPSTSSSTSAYVAFAAGATTCFVALLLPYAYQLTKKKTVVLPDTYVTAYESVSINKSVAADSVTEKTVYEAAIVNSRKRIPKWTSAHLKNRYCGLLYEVNDAGYATIWGMKIVIESRDTSTTGVVGVTGYIRWRIVDVEPQIPLGTWMRYEEKIEQKWEADEVFTGKLDLTLGSLQTASHAMRAIEGNPADPLSHIAAGAYTFVLMQDGNELVGGYTAKPEHYSASAAAASINRCFAY